MFKNKEIDQVARVLAEDFCQRFPLSLHAAKRDKKTDKKLGQALRQAYRKANEFHAGEKLGVYGRARLGNTFQWELREKGYSSEFAAEATKGLLMELNRT